MTCVNLVTMSLPKVPVSSDPGQRYLGVVWVRAGRKCAGPGPECRVSIEQGVERNQVSATAMSLPEGSKVTIDERTGDRYGCDTILSRKEKMVGNRHSPLCESPAQSVNILMV